MNKSVKIAAVAICFYTSALFSMAPGRPVTPPRAIPTCVPGTPYRGALKTEELRLELLRRPGRQNEITEGEAARLRLLAAAERREIASQRVHDCIADRRNNNVPPVVPRLDF